MNVLQKLAKAGHLAAGCVQHIVALAAAGKSVPEIVADEVLDGLKEVHDGLAEKRNQHAPQEIGE